MSNLPLGAAEDPTAPFNIKETRFKFDIGVKGVAWYEYYGDLDVSDAIETIKERISGALEQVGDIEVHDLDMSIY